MNTETHTLPNDSAADAAPLRPALDESIERLVALSHEAKSSRAFLRSALEIIASTLCAPAAVLELRMMSQVVTEKVANPPEQEAFWSQTIQSVLTDAMSDKGPRARMYSGKQENAGVALLSAPIRSADSRISGALALVTACPNEEHARELLTSLSSLAFLTAMLIDSPGSNVSAGPPAADTSAMANLRKVTQYESTTELAYAITNKLRARDGCDTVALAQVSGVDLRILSISGLDDISSKSPGVRCIQAAMEECFDVGQTIVNQPNNDLDPDAVITQSRLHARWTDQAGGAAVASIPLTVEDEVVAVVSVRRSPDASFTAEDLEELRSLVEPYAATLEIIECARRSLPAHARQAARKTLGRLLSHKDWGLKAMVLAPILVMTWLVFGSMQYEVVVPASVKLADARHVSSPQDGKLSAVHFYPGDTVKAGDLLCEFDVSELILEKQSLRSELQILRIRENQALANEDPVEHQLARASKKQLEANLWLVEHRIASGEVRAPIDGTLVVGDMNDRIGDVFSKGEPMFKVAAEDGWRIELEIPESSVTNVKGGMEGYFASVARPEDTHLFRVRRVDPNAEQRQGKNVFVAEADAILDAEWIRSGMEGLAKVDAGKRAPWWVLFHDIEEWVQLHLWL